MRQLIFDNMSQCTEAEVERLCRILPRHRVEQALKYKHTFGQFCCLKSYEMLLSLGLPQTPFSYNEYGKPFIPDGPYFSISHCKEAIAVCIDDEPVGVDIESLRSADRSLVERTMNADEQRRIAESDAPQCQFIALWTRKEAYLKYKGTGIIDDLHNVLVNIDSDVIIETQLLHHSDIPFAAVTFVRKAIHGVGNIRV